jgi:hypothetical protein
MANITDAERLARARERLVRAERLARAVLLFHRGGRWDYDDTREWRELTGTDCATTKTLANLARGILGEGSTNGR